MDPYIGEIRLFAGNYAPRDWAFCNGQILSISTNPALFSVLGTTYGGDGKTTFALPNFQGTIAMGQGAGPGLTPRNLRGSVDGDETVTITSSSMPDHSHVPQGSSATGGGVEDPAEAVWGAKGPIPPGNTAYAQNVNVNMNVQVLDVTGGSQPHNNVQPYVAINFIICLDGVYPSKP